MLRESLVPSRIKCVECEKVLQRSGALLNPNSSTWRAFYECIDCHIVYTLEAVKEPSP